MGETSVIFLFPSFFFFCLFSLIFDSFFSFFFHLGGLKIGKKNMRFEILF